MTTLVPKASRINFHRKISSGILILAAYSVNSVLEDVAGAALEISLAEWVEAPVRVEEDHHSTASLAAIITGLNLSREKI